ncbi:hypothetical protein V6N13_137458 [Hibiscus sabdariffa]|uniref:Uncharacterized protein n=1 Tax=Hibiscus sabdariffa TaxID=183260 RepID=A0ABR2DKL1_9ROSI
MDHDDYDGVSCVAAAVPAAASAVSATSAVDASFRPAPNNDSSPFLGLVPVSGSHHHRHRSLKFAPEAKTKVHDPNYAGQ